MQQGSRWWTPVFEGLFAKKHVEAMGSAIWLYGWMLMRAHVAQRDGAFAFNQQEAAEELGVNDRTIRRWFTRLQEHGYLITRARHPYHLEVEIAKWRPIEQWRGARVAARTGSSVEVPPSRRDEEGEVGQKCPRDRTRDRAGGRAESPYLSIYRSSEAHPDPTGLRAEGATEPIALAEWFKGFIRKLKESKNQPAELREFYILCFGESGAPDYGYVGKVMNRVGPARLAQLFWELVTRPPVGDVLAYIQATVKGRKGKKSESDRHKEIDEYVKSRLGGTTGGDDGIL